MLTERLFAISERGSTVRAEVLAGVATFATMAYILAVNPSVLGALPDAAGVRLDHAELVTVTALVAGVLTIAMGLFANVPFALAAGLGINAFVAYTLVAGEGLGWAEAMGVVVVEGLVMLVLVVAGLREAVMNAIPDALKRAIGAGIGLFIAFIGFVDAGIVARPDSDAPIVALTPDLGTWTTAVFVVGLVAMAVLMARRVPGALLIGIVLSTGLAIVVNQLASGTPIAGAVRPDRLADTPDLGLVGAFSLDFFSTLGLAAAVGLVLTVLMANFFDAMGTALALGRRAGLTDAEGRLPQMRRVLLVESAGAVAGGAASASSNTIYIESSAGVEQGGRTGLANVVTGVLFLAAMFFAPLVGMIPAAATAPALVIVGALMLSVVADIDWEDVGLSVPAFATIALMPFTFSIANGVGAGMVLYVLIAVLRGRWRDVHPLLAVVAGFFVWYFLHGTV
jgi:AGZA family xanthine/uracil permease-like MFS transporter